MITPAQEALIAVQNAMQEAYNSAYLVCCGKGTVHGCCGDPVAEWSAADARIMEVLDPVQKAILRLVQNPLPAGWVAVPVEPTQDMIECGFSRARYNDGLSTRVGVYRAMIAAAPKLESAK